MNKLLFSLLSLYLLADKAFAQTGGKMVIWDATDPYEPTPTPSDLSWWLENIKPTKPIEIIAFVIAIALVLFLVVRKLRRKKDKPVDSEVENTVIDTNLKE